MNDLRPKLDYLDPRSRERVLSALEVANVAHSGQLRKSGEPFIIHPIAVAAILADLRMDTDCIIAGLLHDTVEDTAVTLEDLETLFGTDVRRIVEGETKLTKLAKKMRSDPQHPQTSNPSNSNSHMQDSCTTATQFTPTNSYSIPPSPAMPNDSERDKREEELQKQADNLRAMFIAMTEDVRVIIVKLADRLHNMRTLAHMNPTKQKKIAKETLQFFAPLAHRLGMRRIKSELEELSFMYLHPEDYQHLKYEVETMLSRSKFDHYLKSAEATIKDVLQQDRILYNMIRCVQVTGSTKELYSIYRRIQAGENVSAMLDIATMRVVVDLDPGVDSNQACYHVLGRIHTMWKPLPKRLKDYIAFPKPNGYQSLHTTVLLGPKFNFLTMEIQIRTAEMHRVAEEGIAAELFMAGSAANQGSAGTDDDSTNKEEELNTEWRRRTTGWLLNIREYIKEFSSSKDLIDAVRKDLLGNRVFVFTPKGNIVDLPKDSTPIDVAYRIHSDVGDSMIGAKVNGRLVSLDYKLQNADVVKIISSQFSKGPSPEWISYAKSRTARQKIRQFLRARNRDNMLDRGRRLLEDEARAVLEPIPDENCLTEIIPRLCAVVVSAGGVANRHMSSVDDLYVEIARRAEAEGSVPLERTVLRLLRDRRHKSISQALVQRRRAASDHDTGQTHNNGVDINDDEHTYKQRVMRDGEENGPVDVHVEAMLAPCCHPIRGDEVRGIWMRGDENEVLMIHRHDCQHVSMADKRNDNGGVDGPGCEKTNVNGRGLHDVVHVKWAVRQHEIDDGVQQAGLSMLQQIGHRRRRRWLNHHDDDDDVEIDDLISNGYSDSDDWKPSGSEKSRGAAVGGRHCSSPSAAAVAAVSSVINDPHDGEAQQPARLVVVARDCTGLLAYVTGIMAGMATSIQRCATVTDRDGMTATLAFEVLVRDAFHLRRIIERIDECDEVESTRRIGANESHLFFPTDALTVCAAACQGACGDGSEAVGNGVDNGDESAATTQGYNGERAQTQGSAAAECEECERKVCVELLRRGQRVPIGDFEVDGRSLE